MLTDFNASPIHNFNNWNYKKNVMKLYFFEHWPFLGLYYGLLGLLSLLGVK